MLMSSGGGGKGNRQQSSHHHYQQNQQQQQQQQNHHNQNQSRHQTHSHTQHHQQQQQILSRIPQQDQQQQPLQPHTVLVAAHPQHHHLQQQSSLHHPQSQQQQQQVAHHLPQKQFLFYAPPPPLQSLSYAGHAPQYSSSSSSNGSNGGAALQLSGAASNSSLGGRGALGHGGNNHHGQAVNGVSTFLSATYLPFNHPAQVLAAATTPGGFYPQAASIPAQKQPMPPGQTHGVAGAATYYQTALPPGGNNNAVVGGAASGGNGTQRGNIRGGVGHRSTPPQQAPYYPYAAVPGTSAIQPRAAAPIVGNRAAPLNGNAAFHLPPGPYFAGIPIGPPPKLASGPIIAAAAVAGLTGPTAGSTTGTTGLPSYALHLQSPSATSIGGAMAPAMGTTFSSTGMTPAVTHLASLVKGKERRPHAIPIINPITQEDVLETTVFNKRDSDCTPTTTSSECSLSQHSSTPLGVDIVHVKDYQMQTEAAAKDVEVPSPSPPPTDDAKVSVIVKDILANSSHPEENLIFWQKSDVDNAAESSYSNTEIQIKEASATVSPVLFQEATKGKPQRPKSANKQSTATPTSIATAVAEAAANATGVNKSMLIMPNFEKSQQQSTNVNVEPASATPSPSHSIKGQRQKSVARQASASSSAASTPTHQQQHQQQQKMVRPISGLVSDVLEMAHGGNLSKKNQRRVQKRKEQENKKKNKAVTSTTEDTKCTSSGGTEMSLIFMTTKTVGEAATTPPPPTTTDKLSATSNNSSLSISLREKQPKENDDNKIDNKHVKRLANEEIMAKFLTNNAEHTTHGGVDGQLEFLNSSTSVCDEEHRETDISKQGKAVNLEEVHITELKFGDFNEDITPHNTDFISSSSWTGSQLGATAEATSSEGAFNDEDSVDCAPSTVEDIRLSSSSFNSPSPQPKQQLAESMESSPAAPVFIRYTLASLREMAKYPLSNTTPLVPCQKGDCISQLFVSRQSQQQQPQHHLQYQHSHESQLEYMSGGKRGRGHGHGSNKKYHDGYQSAGGGNQSGNNPNQSGNNSNQRYMDVIRVQLSLKEEIKLSECENAWQPETLRRGSIFSSTPEVEKDNDIDQVVKKVRGILNKLTPDNFEVLLKEMSSITMDTEKKMKNVMLLIFEKTVSEPNFAPTYARFCKVLFHEIKAENKSLFTCSLISRIQHEFETNVNDADAKSKKLQPIVDRMNACTDPIKKAELAAEIEEKEYQFRRRAWGTVRFIGELYKLQSLTSDRVLHCVESLLEHGCEEKLEYMCKLLTTVGHLVEAGPPEQYHSGVRIEKIFRRIQEIVQRTRSTNSRQQQQLINKISSRVRFMMQDVLDLRARHWDQPVTTTSTNAATNRAGQRGGHKPSDETKSQPGRGVQQQSYQYQQQLSKQQHQHQQHGHDGGNHFMQKGGKSQQHDNQSLSIDPNKLRFSCSSSNEDANAKLGNSSHYQWRNVGNRPVTTATVASPAAQPQPTLLKRAQQQAPAVQPHTSFAYAPYQQQQQQQPASSSQITPLPFNNRNDNNNAMESARPPQIQIANFDGQQCQKLLTKLVEEAISTKNWHSEVTEMWREAITKPQQAEDVIFHVLMDYVHGATVKRQQRLACANVFTHLLEQQAFDMATFGQAYDRFSNEVPDLLWDVPDGWTYVFEFVGPIMHDGHLQLKDLWQRRWLDDTRCSERFVRSFVSYFVQEFGAGYAHKLWHVDNKLDRGQLFWSDGRKYLDFVKSNSFQFLDAGTAAGLQRPKVTRTPTEHVERISYLLTSVSSDMAIDYITTNVHISANFVRHLTKFLSCDFALTVTSSKSKKGTNNNNNNQQLQLNVELFKSHCIPLLRLCIDAQEAHEVACIEETVASLRDHFMFEVEDELAAIEPICNALSILYDCEVISRDSFDRWINREADKSDFWQIPLLSKLRAIIVVDM